MEDYPAEIDVELVESDDEWAPYLSVEDACKLDDVRELLREGKIEAAAKKARIYELTLIAESG